MIPFRPTTRPMGPVTVPPLGSRVFVRYLDPEQGGVGYSEGTLGIVETEDGSLKEIVVETDGAARFIPVARLIAIEVAP